MAKKTLGIDLDGVLADTISRWLIYAETKHGITATKKDLVIYHMPELFAPLTQEDFMAGIKEVWNDYKSIGLEDRDIPAIIDNLHSKFRIAITTANVNNAVKDWLEYNKISYDELVQFDSPKAKHKLEHVNIYIDDFHEIVESAVSVGKEAILLRQPWNDEFIEGNKDQRIIVAYNWREIEQILLTQMLTNE